MSSKIEFVIAIDDDDSDHSDDGNVEESISQTIESMITKIESLAQNVGSDGKSVEIVDHCSDNESNDKTGCQGSGSVDQLANETVIKPIDDIEDVDNMEVNIYSKYDESSDEFDPFDDDMEAEDCMIIEYMTDIQRKEQTITEEQQTTSEVNDSDDDDIQVLEDIHPFGYLLNGDQQNQTEDIIELSDDEEECVIINDTFSRKLNKIIETDGPLLPPFKRSNSAVHCSDSFIPLSEPSTSSRFNSRLSPVLNFRNPKRKLETSSANSPHSSMMKESSSTSFTPLKNLFSTTIESTYIPDRQPIQVCSSYYQPNITVRREQIQENNRSDFYNSYSTEQNRFDNRDLTSEEDRLLYDSSIPFICEGSRPSTSSDTIDSSNVSDINIICESVKLDRNIVQNVVNLIEDHCTVPFIVRYRQSAISGIDADRVHKINNIFNELKAAKERAKDVEQMLGKQNRINPRLKSALSRCKNVFEVDQLFKLCRNESPNAQKYRNLGLSDSAVSVLEGKRLDPNHFVNRFAFGLDTPDKIEEGWSAIIADILSKDCDVIEFLIKSTKQYVPILQTEFVMEKADELRRGYNPKNSDLIDKYLRFATFTKPVNKINAHTYMAIERGEDIGLLKVCVEFDSIILNKLIELCLKKWNRCISNLLVHCVRIAFNNQLKLCLQDYIRFELRHNSHMTALDVFRTNVKHILMEPPLRGEFVIGVDPGYGSGYKVAVVSPWLVPLDACILKLDFQNYESSAIKLRRLMIENRCTIIALGNGTGCRQFEDMLQQKISSGFFGKINVKYKVINESGVSWYSVTEEAKRDLPNFPPHMIGAISIARRLIDPLSELVKVDPKRLQVGMYMRDIEEEAVKKAFHEVAVECVSFCGVDVNVASLELLSKVAGLEPNIARLIIEKRERDGLFNSRSQLKNIDGIGWKQFEQCAGFIKVMPLTRRETITPTKKEVKDNDFPNKRFASSTDDYDPLDSTIVHPESYSCANTYLELIGATKEEIGKQSIRTKIALGYEKYGLPEIAQLCNTHAANMKLIIEGLSNSIDFDYRTNFAQIYVPDIQNFEDLTIGMSLKGRVVNVTPMGAFIDCGIIGGINAYLRAKECERHSIVVNDNVLVTIESINKNHQRFGVNLNKVFKTNIKFI